MASSLLTGIVAYWKLDESSGNPADSAGSGLTLTNNGTTTFASALVNNGADLGTSNSTKFFSRADALSMNLANAFSASLWVKIRTEIASGIWNLMEISDATRHVALRIFYDYNSGSRRITVQRQIGGVSFDTVNYTVTLGTSDWYNLVVRYNATTLEVYLNGVSVGSIASSGTGSGFGTSRTTVGQGFNESTMAYDGSFPSTYYDEIGVWSKQVSTQEISDLYNIGNANQYPFLTQTVTVAETSTGTEAYAYISGKTITVDETSTATESLTSSAPTTAWTKQSENTSTWTNQTKN